ncbi:MAG TPA: alpha/beta hydrolase [Vicinamibacterales bacterium]|nr:alpha/beta hydrolase [Vicinamibacterales bacterium]
MTNTGLPTSEGYARSADGVRLYYRCLGSGSGTVVIPVAAWWGAQPNVLAHHMQVVLYDPRGRGRSDTATESTPVGIDHAIADLESIRLQLGLERVSLMGWSYLGAIVVLYAAAHPEAVDRIVQVSPLPPRRDPHWDAWMASYSARAAPLMGESDTSGIRDGLLTMLLPQLGDTSTAEAIVDSVGTDLPNEHPANIANLGRRAMASLGGWDFRERAGRVVAPVLTVHGDRDNIPLAASQEWVQALPNARLLRFEGAGHYAFYERPEPFFGAVAEFLDGRWPAGAESLPRRPA